MVVVIDRLILEMETKLKNLNRVDQFSKRLDKLGVGVNKAGRLFDKGTIEQ